MRQIIPMQNSIKIASKLAFFVLALQASITTASGNYVAESYGDGIPVISARSIAPTDQHLDWRFDPDSLDSDSARSHPIAQRRANFDEDGVENDDDDDERDEYPSSSVNHGSYENPSFGESQKAARDGEEIENFFDRHIGPEEVAAAASMRRGDHDIPISEIPASGSSGPVDPDEQFEAAASSPLATILQTLISAHKRPLIIETSDGPGSVGGITASNSAEVGQQDGTSSIPIAASLPYLAGLPLAAAPSSLSAFGAQIASTSNQQQQQDESSGGNDGSGVGSDSSSASIGDGSGDDGGIQEIYIARRPSIFRHIQSLAAQSSGQSLMAAAQQQQQQLQQAPQTQMLSGASYFRGSAPSASRLYMNGMIGGGAQGADFARYPVAASYAHQQQQESSASASASPDDDGTVVYGLSFGGGATESADEGEGSPSAGSSNDDRGPIEEPSGYSPLANGARNLAALPLAPPPRFQQGYSYRNYQQQQQQNQPQASRGIPVAGGYPRYSAASPEAIQQQQQYRAQQFYPVRYHKDPSESVEQPAGSFNQNQFSGPNSNNFRGQISTKRQQPGVMQQVGSNTLAGSGSTRDRLEWQLRQKLLTDLNQQIKQHPLYQTHQPTSRDSSESKRSFQRTSGASGPIKQRQPNSSKSAPPSDVDTYSSIHSEENPRSSYLRMVQLQAESSGLGEKRLVEPSGSSIVPLIRENPSTMSSNTSSVTRGGSSGATSSMQRASFPGDLLRSSAIGQQDQKPLARLHRRRREDADDRESDDADEDGVWVDDDEDDDNSKQSSDVNETAQEPEQEEDQASSQGDQQQLLGSQPIDNMSQTSGRATNGMALSPTANMIAGSHGYELSPEDLLAYPG